MRYEALNLRIYTLDRLFLDDVISKIDVVGREGRYTILPNHIDYISSFIDSNICYTKSNGEKIYVWMDQGILVKSGRELQISTFLAINNGNKKIDSKNKIDSLNVEFGSSLEFNEQLKIMLKNIEHEMFNRHKVISKERI